MGILSQVDKKPALEGEAVSNIREGVMTPAADPIRATAIRFARLYARASDLRRKRFDTICQREGYSDGDGYAIATQEGPCWKWRRPSVNGDPYNAPDLVYVLAPSEWCSACQKRQEIHREYREVTKERGAALRALVARVRRLPDAG